VSTTGSETQVLAAASTSITGDGPPPGEGQGFQGIGKEQLFPSLAATGSPRDESARLADKMPIGRDRLATGRVRPAGGQGCLSSILRCRKRIAAATASHRTRHSSVDTHHSYFVQSPPSDSPLTHHFRPRAVPPFEIVAVVVSIGMCLAKSLTSNRRVGYCGVLT
jgi:hypothetical protein